MTKSFLRLLKFSSFFASIRKIKAVWRKLLEARVWQARYLPLHLGYELSSTTLISRKWLITFKRPVSSLKTLNSYKFFFGFASIMPSNSKSIHLRRLKRPWVGFKSGCSDDGQLCKFTDNTSMLLGFSARLALTFLRVRPGGSMAAFLTFVEG